jgi:hypothetical protein
VAQMLMQEPIYKPSSIFRFKPILLSAHNLILLIYGDNSKQQDGNDGAHHVRPSAKNQKPGSDIGRGDGDHRREVMVNAGRRRSGGERGDRSAPACHGD